MLRRPFLEPPSSSEESCAGLIGAHCRCLFQDISQVLEWVDLLRSAASEERVIDSGDLAATFTAEEKKVLSSESDLADRTFHIIVVDGQSTVVNISLQGIEVSEYIGDGVAESGAGQDFFLGFSRLIP